MDSIKKLKESVDLKFYQDKKVKIIYDNGEKIASRPGVFMGTDGIFVFVLTEHKEIESIPYNRIVRIIEVKE